VQKLHKLRCKCLQLTAHGLSLLERGWLISNFWVLVVVVVLVERTQHQQQFVVAAVAAVVAVL
jgi:hypothetical protein